MRRAFYVAAAAALMVSTGLAQGGSSGASRSTPMRGAAVILSRAASGAGGPSARAGAGPLADVLSDPFETKYEAALSGVAGAHRGRWWVFFTDKGLGNPSRRSAALAGALTSMTEKARERRLNRTGSLALDITDLRVNPGYLEALSAAGVAVKGASRWLNAASVYATAPQLDAIARMPFVKKIRPVATFTRSRTEEVVPSVQGRSGPSRRSPAADPAYYNRTYDQLQQIDVPAVHDLGYKGEGIIICMLDTGFNLAHEAFLDLDVVGERDFIQADSVTSNQPGDDPNQHNHGTLTLSTIGGLMPNEFVGGAPNAQFALAKTEIVDQEIQIEEDYYVMGLEWADSLGATVVSSSLGYLDWYTYADMDGETAVTTVGADIAASKGITVVTAMGNERATAWHYLIAPADADSVIAVGAVDLAGDLTYFSSMGPTYDGRIKPDVVALGYHTAAASYADSNGYVLANGTSLSTPLIAASAALVAQAHPDWSPIEIRQALRNSADQAFSPDTLRGWGLPDVLAAVEMTTAGAPTPGEGLVTSVSAYPNPFHARATLSFVVPQEAGGSVPVEVSVFDAKGRLVRTLFEGRLPPGPHATEWDGRDASGRRAPTGVYMFDVRYPGGSEGSKVILVN
jgi:serine protease AprX